MASKTLHSSALEICQRAMAILRQENRLTTIAPDAPTKVERACYDAYEATRLELLSSYGWSFIKADMRVNNGASHYDADGRYRIAYPAVAMKVLKCYDEDGHKVPFTVRGRQYIYSLRPIHRITYIYDEEDATLYPPLVRDAFVKLLAKNLCVEVTGRNADLQMIASLSQQAIQAARTDDARISCTGSETYGRNYLYEVMCGRRNPFVRKGL